MSGWPDCPGCEFIRCEGGPADGWVFRVLRRQSMKPVDMAGPGRVHYQRTERRDPEGHAIFELVQ